MSSKSIADPRTQKILRQSETEEEEADNFRAAVTELMFIPQWCT